MLARTDSRARALVLLLVVGLVATAIGARLVWWQVAQHDWLTGMALHQLAQHEQLPAERGEITDVNGALLASSVELRSVFATPPTIADPAAAARQLAPILRMDRERAARPARERRSVGVAASSHRSGGGRGGCRSRDPGHRDAAGDEARLPGRRRGDRDDAGRPGSRLRRRRWRGSLRHRGRRGGSPRRRAGHGDRPGGRHRPAHRRVGVAAAGADRRRRPAADDRRRDPGPARAPAVGVLQPEPRPRRHRRDHGRRDRRDRGDGQLSLVRRESLRHHRRRALREPGDRPPVRARIGDEGVHRRGRARLGRHHPDGHVHRRQQSPHRARPSPERRSLRPSLRSRRHHRGRGPEAVEQRWRGEDRARAGRRGAVRSIPALRVRGTDGDRARGRGVRTRVGSRPGRMRPAT